MIKRLLPVLIAGSLTLLLIIGWSASRRYGVGHFVEPLVGVFHSNDELFIFVNRTSAAINHRRGDLWLRAISQVPLSPITLRDYYDVIHLTNGAIARSLLKASGGSPSCFNGKIYWGKGRFRNEHGPHHWRWNGTNFVALEENEWAEIKRERDKYFKLNSEMNAKEGWTETWLRLDERNPQVTFKIGGGQFQLVRKVERLGDKGERVVLTLGSLNGSLSAEVLVDQVEGYKDVTRAQYLQAISTAPKRHSERVRP